MTTDIDACTRLTNFLTEGEPCILFAGAGVSAHAGLPIWRQYLEQLAEFARIHDVMTRHHMHERLAENDFLSSAELYFLCKKIPQNEKYKNLVTPLTSYDKSALTSLMKFQFSSVVTTNYDRALHDAYAEAHKCSAEEVNLDDRTLTSAPFNDRFYIARIHGRVEVPENMQLGERHYEKLQDNTDYQSFLAHLFTRKRILFIGFSFLDPAIRNIFQTLERKVGKYHEGRHLALLPDNADDEFIQKLELFAIQKVFYSAKNKHEELWQCIDQTKEITPAPSTVSEETRSDPFNLTKKYLCACFARVSLGSKMLPLRNAVTEGITSSIITSAGDSGITDREIYRIVSEELALTEEDTIPIVDKAISNLISEGVARKSNEKKSRLFTNVNDEATFNSERKILEDGVINRLMVRSSGEDLSVYRKCLRTLFDSLISRRGWDLGASFAAGQVPDQLEIPAMMRTIQQCTEGIKTTTTIDIARAVENLLKHPNNKESQVLTELGRASFALELVTNKAHDTLFHSLTLPERIYIDANVLMPAFAPGHPYHETYRNTIRKLLEASAGALSSVEIIAYKGFLNEVVSHRRLAIEEMSAYENKSLEFLKKEALMYGTVNMNVYVGAYANTLANNNELTFHQYLQQYASYNTESELAQWLTEKGISIKSDAELKRDAHDLPSILHILEKAYADGYWNKKERTLIMHDAVQLAALSRDINEGKRVVFVSADRRLRDNVSRSKISSVAHAIISHIGLTQLVELLVGKSATDRGLSSMMWSVKTTDASEQIRNYLLDQALKQYDVSYAMEMSRVVDYITEDALIALNQQGLNTNTSNPKEKAMIMEVLEGFEEQYYQKMREAIESKRQQDQNK